MKIAILYLLSALACMVVPLSVEAKDLKIMHYGAWGLALNADPFKNKYPVVSYLPPGTILFQTQPSPPPLGNYGYVEVLSQYGHRLHIKKTMDLQGEVIEISVFSSIKGLLKEPPTDSLIFHKSVLCLGQSNRISKPPYRCNKIGDDISSTLPVGKGWIYGFKKSNRGPKWLNLKVVLDKSTKDELAKRGIMIEETGFDITKTELSELERQGVITMLNKPMPPVTFEYESSRPVFIECGQKTVSEKELKASMGIIASAEVGGEVPFWARLFTGIKAKLGLSVTAEGAASANKTWSITTDTTNSSYLYYTVKMIDDEKKEAANIFIEKTFECQQVPNKPGEKMTKIVFEVERPGSPDIEEYTFENPEEYISVPNELLNHIPRPVFFSVNSSEQHSEVVKKLAEKQSVDVPMAHFMVSHLNNTCQSSKREKCKNLIEQQNDQN